MRDLQIALVQGHWGGDQASTQTLYRELVAEAAASGAELICLPEFTLLPYFPGRRDVAGFRWAEPLPGGKSDVFFSELAQQHHVHIIGSLFERDSSGKYWDTATIHAPDGLLRYFTRKMHIPSGAGYHESDYFGGAAAFPVHDIGALRLGAPTCYDQWFPELARIYALEGAEFLFYPSAIGSEPEAPGFDSAGAWRAVMCGHAAANGLYIAACNRVGYENDVTFYGSSFICDPLGNVLAQASRDKDEVITAQLRASLREEVQRLFPLLHQRMPQHYSRLLQGSRTRPEARS